MTSIKQALRVGGWLGVVTCSGGLCTWMPLLVTARLTRRRVWRRLSAASAAGAVAAIAATTVCPLVGGVLFVALIVLGCAHVLGSRALREGADGLPDALVAAEERLRSLELARRIAAREPRRARALGIGRPDLAWAFHGDLIDVNHAPGEVLSATGGLGPELGARIVALREHAGPFTSLADLDYQLELPPARLEQLAEVAVFLPDR